MLNTKFDQSKFSTLKLRVSASKILKFIQNLSGANLISNLTSNLQSKNSNLTLLQPIAEFLFVAHIDEA